MKRLFYFIWFAISVAFIPPALPVQAEPPPLPPLMVFYDFPYVRVQWTVSGCVVYDGPQTPTVWFDEACRIGAGYQVIPPNPPLGPAYIPTAGMKITLLGLDNQFIASVTLDNRADYPYTVYLPYIERENPYAANET